MTTHISQAAVGRLVRRFVPLKKSDARHAEVLKELTRKLNAVVKQRPAVGGDTEGATAAQTAIVEYLVHRRGRDRMRKFEALKPLKGLRLPAPMPHAVLYRTAPRDADFGLSDAAWRAQAVMSQHPDRRVAVYERLHKHLVRAGADVWSRLHDFVQFGTESVYGTVHIACLTAAGWDKWLLKLKQWVSSTSSKAKSAVSTSGLPRNPTASDICMRARRLSSALPDVPFFVAMKLETSRGPKAVERIRREKSLLWLGNLSVQHRICYNFSVVYTYAEAQCDTRFAASLFPDPPLCGTVHTHGLAAELSNGDLRTWLKQTALKGAVSPSDLTGAVFQIMAGITTVNEVWGIAHNDLHDANVLYNTLASPTDMVLDIVHLGLRVTATDQRSLFKIWDFGLAKPRSVVRNKHGDAEWVLGRMLHVTRKAKDVARVIRTATDAMMPVDSPAGYWGGWVRLASTFAALPGIRVERFNPLRYHAVPAPRSSNPVMHSKIDLGGKWEAELAVQARSILAHGASGLLNSLIHSSSGGKLGTSTGRGSGSEGGGVEIPGAASLSSPASSSPSSLS